MGLSPRVASRLGLLRLVFFFLLLLLLLADLDLDGANLGETVNGISFGPATVLLELLESLPAGVNVAGARHGATDFEALMNRHGSSPPN